MKRSRCYTIITGASDGFGKALAIECARRGMDLILVALPGPELQQLARFIGKNFFVDVKLFEADLTIEAECYQLHSKIIEGNWPVNILINNAGMGNTQMFGETSPEFMKQQIKLNVLATTLLTRLFIPQLKKHAPSHVLNVGSLCSFFYLPKKQVYGATKSFIYFFSKSLRKELKRDDISVSVVCPGGMNTNFSVSLMNRKAGFFTRIAILNPEEAAPIVIEKMLKGKEVIIPGTVNRFTVFLDKMLPAFFKSMLTDSLMKGLKPVNNPTINVNQDLSPMAA
ncbi:MAG TPA: SDR family NAD(P)-dependent oxidoreductase [Chitinophagaceae bacterium]|nr:SDR family NAD(P)-dependent oxidoreductase [Chitinophagaceae bacterium]